MRLQTADVDRYGPLTDWRPPVGEGITVLSGANEAGKTLYLEALLQLLDPAVADHPGFTTRVDGDPVGRVTVEVGRDVHECPDRPLSTITQIEPRHLQSVFVVRDSDLALPDDRDYYTGLVETLGEIHTTEIEAIRSALIDRGRLTDTRLDVSSDRSYDSAGDVRDAAADLAAEVREYVTTVEEEGLDDLQAERLRTRRTIERTRDRLETQRRAERVAEYERLSEALATYRETSAELADLDVDESTLDDLRAIASDIERDADRIDDLAAEIDDRSQALDAFEDELAERTARRNELERRQPAIEQARDALDASRQTRAAAVGADRTLALTRLTAPAASLGAGAGAVVGAVAGSIAAVAVGGALAAVAVLAIALWYRSNRRQSAVERAEQTALEAARDAGLDVERVDDIAPAIEAVENELDRVTDRVTALETDIDRTRDRLEELHTETDRLESDIEDARTTIDDRLGGIESIEAYEARLDRYTDLETERQLVAQRLRDAFGDPDGDDPDAVAAAWTDDCEALIDGIDTAGVSASTYDESTHDRLDRALEELTDDLERLETALADHRDRLDAFDNRARSLDTRPFVDRSLALPARTKAGLDTLREDLESVVAAIEDDAECSRKAIAVFERIETEEEAKLADLFAPDGVASRTFEHLTDGRYTEVSYDVADHRILAERATGRRLDVGQLSHATTDQLYFATRVSLASQLLASEPGVLLLDDPFLAADPDRLVAGFETLGDLAADGWQILYLTAKREVFETMVDAFDLRHESMPPIGPDA